jgi:hypothetical protein
MIMRRGSANSKVVLFVTVAVLVLAGIFYWLAQDPDIVFARRVFTGLVNGEESAQSLIDWPNFKAVGQDIGTTYSRLVEGKPREVYRKAFILNFSLVFKSSGGRLDPSLLWSVRERTTDSATVSLKTPSGRFLLFGISQKGKIRKLVNLKWEEEK